MSRFTRWLAEKARQVNSDGLKEIHKEVAAAAASAAQSEARMMGGLQGKAASRIKGRGTDRAARVVVSKTKTTPYAYTAFWGQKKRSGWYAWGRYANAAASQHPEWVGNTWDVAVKGQGPYAINDALAENLDAILDIYKEKLQQLLDE